MYVQTSVDLCDCAGYIVRVCLLCAIPVQAGGASVLFVKQYSTRTTATRNINWRGSWKADSLFAVNIKALTASGKSTCPYDTYVRYYNIQRVRIQSFTASISMPLAFFSSSVSVLLVSFLLSALLYWLLCVS